jgi:hypothetical protein
MNTSFFEGIKVKKTLGERLNGKIWVRSPPLHDNPARIQGKKTIKRAFFERMTHNDQRKMIIYLNAWTVILHEVNNP